MLDVRRFFQDDNDSFPPCTGDKSTSASQADYAETNVHLVDFARSEIVTSDARFPQVDEILDRLDNNARAVSGAARWPD